MLAKPVRRVPVSFLSRLMASALALVGLAVYAETDPDQAEAMARNAFIERFTKFTEDKNVMGRPKAPNGKAAGGGKKTRFNQDDGQAYQSDLTYHDLAFNTVETQKGGDDKNNKNAKVSRLFAFVSPHGGVSAAGGSSQLERVVYGLHKQFTKADTEENNKKDDEQKGIKYRSVFKITTQEVIQDQADKNGKKGEPDKVERFELREEARPEVEKVGEESFETIRKAGRDKGYEDDESTLPNGVLLRYAGYEGVKAMWNSTLANLVQRRVNRGIRSGNFPDTPQLSEGVSTCGAWGATANSVLANVKDEGQRKALQEEIQRMTQQCEQLASLPYNVIDPRFEPNEKNGKDELKIQGPAKEDAQIRDLRIQLDVLAKGGADPRNSPSNWKYGEQEARARVTIDFDDSAKPQGEVSMTVPEQIESYNQQLRAAKEGIAEVQTRFPDYNAPDPTQYEMSPDQTSVLQANERAASVPLSEEVGATQGPQDVAETYQELLQQSAR